MRSLLAAPALLALVGCAAGSKPAGRPLTEFSDANFGVRFSHTDALTTEYNPHGGADRVMIAWTG